MTLKYAISLFSILQVSLRDVPADINKEEELYGALPVPGNLTIESVNLKSRLLWSSSPGAQSVEYTYTVQYRVDRGEWLTIVDCSRTRLRQCNLTSVIGEHMKVTLRVRAMDGSRTSSWLQSEPFRVTDQTLLGPPHVTLRSYEGVLYVRIADPFHRNSFSRELNYRLFYKKENSDWTVYDDVTSAVTIDSFEVGLNYCVQARYVWYSKLRPHSVPSTVKCSVVLESDSVRAVRIVWVTAVILFMVILFLVCAYGVTQNYGKLKKALQPPLQLPEHLQKFLTGEDQFVQLPESSASSSNSEEYFDKISVVTIDKEVAEEEHPESQNEAPPGVGSQTHAA